MKAKNNLRHDSYSHFLQNVVKFSCVGPTTFSRDLKYSGAVCNLHLIDAIQIKAKDLTFCNMKTRSTLRYRSYTRFLKNIVRFSFAGKMNLIELVLFRRSENSILVKLTRFCV